VEETILVLPGQILALCLTRNPSLVDLPVAVMTSRREISPLFFSFLVWISLCAATEAPGPQGHGEHRQRLRLTTDRRQQAEGRAVAATRRDEEEGGGSATAKGACQQPRALGDSHCRAGLRDAKKNKRRVDSVGKRQFFFVLTIAAPCYIAGVLYIWVATRRCRSRRLFLFRFVRDTGWVARRVYLWLGLCILLDCLSKRKQLDF
jgi:hypothetical protein